MIYSVDMNVHQRSENEKGDFSTNQTFGGGDLTAAINAGLMTTNRSVCYSVLF
jgi:hypothetical protein